MTKRTSKTLALFLSFLLLFQQSGFAQVAAELDIASRLTALHNSFVIDRFRPLHLRYLEYLPQNNSFKLFLDKGDEYRQESSSGALPNAKLENTSKELLKYFFIGLSLPNSSFWVNLRPDAEDNIIDEYLAKTDIGRIMLETDLQLKKDTAQMTSPSTPEGREYWDKLYRRVADLYGYDNITIPTLTRPWIVPGEIIVRESKDSAYIYKATLKVMLEQDYLKDSSTYNFKDSRSKALNEYSSELIRELIIPKLTKEVNSSKRYAPLRQVYYSLILAQWFKARNQNKDNQCTRLINQRDLTNLISKDPWSKTTYFQAYQKSFKEGEYNLQEPVYTPTGQTIRSYFSGGEVFDLGRMPPLGQATANPTTGSTISSIPTASSPAVNPNIVIGLKVTPTDNPGEFLITQEPSGGSATITAQDEADLQRKVTAINKAHKEIGKGHSLGGQNTDGTFERNEGGLSYTVQEITQKARILKEAGLTREERRRLIEYGIAGTQQWSEAKKMPFGRTPLPRDSKDLLLYLSLGQLFEKLNDEYRDVRQAVAQAIAEIAKTKPELTKEIFTRLLEKLNDSDRDVRQAAAQAIAEIAKTKPELTKEIFTRLLEKLNDEYWGVRQAAAQAIAEIAKTKPELITKEILTRLFEKLNDSDRDVRQAAAQAIAEIAKTKPELTKEIFTRLFEKLNDSDWDVRQAAAQAIAEIAKTKPELITKEILTRLFEKLNDSDWDVRQAAAQAIAEIAKTKPELITKEILTRLFEKLNDEYRDVRQAAAQAIAEIAKTKPELITKEIFTRLFEKLNDSDRDVRQAAAQAIAEIAKTKPELTKEIFTRLFEKLNDEYWGVRQAAAQAIAEIAKTKPELTKEIFTRLLEKLNDSDRDVRQAAAQAIAEIAKTKPELTKEIFTRLLEKLNDSDRDVRQAAAQAIAEIAKTKPELTKEIFTRLLEKLNDEYWGVRQAAAQAIAEIAKTKPELITKEILTRLFEKLNDSDRDVRQAAAQAIAEIAKTKPELTKEIFTRLFEKLNDSDWDVRQAAAQAIAEIAKTKPELITKEIFTRLFEKLNDSDWGVRQAAAQAIGEIIARCDMDLTGINHYKEELLNPEGEFGLKEDELSEGYLITSFLLEKEENFSLWLDFADRTDEDFSRLTTLLAGSIMSGAAEEAIKILKEKRSIKEANLSLEELLLKKARLNLSVATRSWDNLQEWLNFCNGFSGRLPDAAIAHIIVTMKLLQAGIGERAGFRAPANIEARLPEIRQALIRLLSKPLSVLTKRRLIKALALGNPDQIDRLRNQAINLAVAVTGSDTKSGLVGEIRDRIHNRPSPQDLTVVRAYRLFVEKEDASRLNRLGYKAGASDRIPERLRQNVLAACDNLIASLEDIYGEGSINSIQEYFQRWQNAVTGQEELKQRISSLISSAAGSSFEYLESIIQIREALQGLGKGLIGEGLLLTILLDNRLETLFYRQFNTQREKIDFSLPQEALKAMSILLANTRLNGYYPEELSIICDELGSLTGEKVFHKEGWLKLYSIYKRIERIINSSSRSAIDDFQQMAERLASGIGAGESIWVENFSSNIFRSDTIYLLSLSLKDAKEAAMQKAGVSGWQVVVPGEAEGRVRFIQHLSELRSVSSDEIIVIERLPSEAPTVTEAAAIITLKEDGLLSHPAIRARQHNIPFAVCPDMALLDGFSGQWAKLSIKGDEVVLTRGKEPAKNKGPPQNLAEKQISIIPADLTSKEIVVMPEDYRPETTGNKSFRLQQVPVDLLPGQAALRHFSLSFSLFSQVLDLGANAEIKTQLLKLKAKALKNPSAADITDTLRQMRLLIEKLEIPDNALDLILKTVENVFGKDRDVRLFLRSSTNAEDLAGYQAAGLYDSFGNIRPQKAEVSRYIKKVWASVWNDRAFFDREANGINHSGVFPAILVQEMILPDYAFVIHTQNPDGADRDELMIELVQGLGESLVSGNEEFTGSPYRFIYNRKAGTLRLIGFANKSKKLILEDGKLKAAFVSYKDDKLLTSESLEFIRAVGEAAVRIEEKSGYPQDIEGALFVQEGVWKVTFLQSRDQPLNGMDDNSSRTASSPAQDNAVSSPAEIKQTQGQSTTTGGIDFRVLPIVTQAMSNLKISLTARDTFRRSYSEAIKRKVSSDLEDEWQEIERMISSGITPSPERIKEYLQASCIQGNILQDKDKVILCIADILRSGEEACSTTNPTLRDILVVLEASGSSVELNRIFLG